MADKKKKKTSVKKAAKKKILKPTKKLKKQTKTRTKKSPKPKSKVRAEKTAKRKIKKTPAIAKREGAAAKQTRALSRREKIMQEIKQKLLSQREALLKEAEVALNTLPGEINFPDMGDQATAETDRNFMLRLRDRERMLLKKIDETIERIDNNSYGICTSCGNEIGIKRLEARPVTDLCIDCKIRQEEEEKITEGG